jgi:sarcosine oxidase, subunit beta
VGRRKAACPSASGFGGSRSAHRIPTARIPYESEPGGSVTSAEVVIVGGGVIGASVAYHLASRGCTDVLVLDAAAAPGGGSTGRATGGYRAQFGSEVDVRLSLLSRGKLLAFREETGVDPGYQPVGYLFLARQEEDLGTLAAAQAVQHAAGLGEARRVDAAEALALNPAVAPGAAIGGVFCPTDGFTRPLEILRGYREAAARLGVRFEYGSPCTGMRVEGGRVRAVRTPAGEVTAGRVVNAAGARAAPVAAMAGIDLPVRPLRRQVAVTAPTDRLPAAMPMTVFAEDGFHLRVRDGRVLLLWPDEPATADPFDDAFDPAWLPEVLRRAHARVPLLRDVPVDRDACWAGLYEMSPDRHAILGAALGVENLFLVNGSSGHGVMHAPALGLLLAEILLDGGARSLDARALRPERFAEGEPNPAPVLL